MRYCVFVCRTEIAEIAVGSGRMFHGCQFLIAVPSPVFARKQIIFDDIFNKSMAVIGSFDSSIRNPSKT